MREAKSQFLDTPSAAEFLGLSRKTLERWRWAGLGPCWHKLGGAVRYSQVELERFAAEAIRGGRADGVA
jgi:predicted DNA-binding transcriptional regulator AlpA